ncbi:MAG: M23 family metallopeptidase [Lachnospiraceae bacterium]|nr:M23 family metallopeptidase [Lachnospiraceae bacterium]
MAIVVSVFFFPTFVKFQAEGNTIYDVSLNGTVIGRAGSLNDLDEYMRNARKRLALESDEIMLVDAELEVDGRDILFGIIDSQSHMEDRIYQVMKQNERETLNRSYTVKINEYTVNLASVEEVHTLLQKAIDRYDTTGQYTAELVLDPTRELNVLTTQMLGPDDVKDDTVNIFQTAGAATVLQEANDISVEDNPKDFADFALGLKELEFGDNVEVVEAYLLREELTPLDEAIDQVTKDQEKETIYEVQPGDTLSQIAENNHLAMADLVDMNETLDSESAMIRAGDELIVTVPEPELSIIRKEEVYLEEDYEAEVQYVDNDQWYTTDQVTLQEPSAGHRNIVSMVSYRNDKETDREILKEEITYQAVPKIVERGTKIPPTYIKPISGGRMSSPFGRRKAPKRGASSFHKGIDWSTPVGTSVVASSAGTVAKAGWGSGYGYVVYINHGDGRQTRYGHLSKVLVKAGQKVQQGTKIALSGNTGVSTGPHVHFEILINGSQVNPLDYLN